MELAVERLASLAFIVTGLSHIAAPRAWTRFFLNMRAQGEAAGLINAYVHMPLGLLILAFHWVWSWPGLIVTAVGLGLALKGALYFVFPRIAEVGLGHIDESSAWRLRAAGLFGLLLGLVMAWVAWTNGAF